MKRFLTLILACTAAPALAQHQAHHTAQAEPDPHPGHAMHGPAADPHAGHVMPAANPHAGHAMSPAPAADPHAGHVMPSADPHAGHAMPAAPITDPHAGHRMHAPNADPHAGHETPAATQADPHAGHAMPAVGAEDSHAGHAMPADPAGDPHAGHDMGHGALDGGPPVLPPPPGALQGPAHAADQFFGGEMAKARADLARGHGAMKMSKFLFDEFEAGFGKGHDAYAWEGQFWHGGDIDKLWIKSEGEGEFGGGLEDFEVQALWSRAIGPWFDFQTGIRQYLGAGPNRTHLAVGFQGLAPYWFEVDSAVFVSTRGDVTARVEAEYDLRLTQRLILQPLIEADFSLQRIEELGVGAGLSTGEAALRLRYEFYPENGPAVIAPYIGVEYERAFGDAADLRRAEGEKTGRWSFLAGVRTWF